jgi:hypothetical protein
VGQQFPSPIKRYAVAGFAWADCNVWRDQVVLIPSKKINNAHFSIDLRASDVDFDK